MSIKAKIELDNSELKHGLKDAENTAKSTMKNIKSTAEGASSTMTKIGNAATSAASAMKSGFSGVASILSKLGPIGIAVAGGIAVIGTAVTGAFNMVGKLTTKLDGIAKAAKSVNMSAEAYQSLQYASSKAGLQMENVLSIISKIDYAMTHAIDGEKKYRDAFYALGLTWEEMERLSPEKQFIKVAEAIGKIRAEGGRLPRELYDIFSKKDIRELEKAGASDFGKFVAQAQALGLNISEEALRRAESYRDTMGDTHKNALKIVSDLEEQVGLVERLDNVLKKVNAKVGNKSGRAPKGFDDLIGIEDIAYDTLIKKSNRENLTLSQKAKILREINKIIEQRAIKEDYYAGRPKDVDKMTAEEISNAFEKGLTYIDWHNLKGGLRKAIYEVIAEVNKDYEFNAEDPNTWLQVKKISPEEQARREEQHQKDLDRSKINSELEYYNIALKQQNEAYDQMNNKALQFVDANKKINELTEKLRKTLKDNTAELDEQVKHETRLNAAMLNQNKIHQEMKNLDEYKNKTMLNYYTEMGSLFGGDKGSIDMLLNEIKKLDGIESVQQFIHTNMMNALLKRNVDASSLSTTKGSIEAIKMLFEDVQNSDYVLPLSESAQKDIKEAEKIYNDFAKKNGLKELATSPNNFNTIVQQFDYKNIAQATAALEEASKDYKGSADELVKAQEALNNLQLLYAPTQVIDAFKEVNRLAQSTKDAVNMINLNKLVEDADRQYSLSRALLDNDKKSADHIEKINALNKLGIKANEENLKLYDELLTRLQFIKKATEQTNAMREMNKRNDATKTNLDLQQATMDYNSAEIDSLKRINALKQMNIEATAENLELYKEQLDKMIELEKHEKSMSFNKTMTNQAESLRISLLEKVGKGRQAAYERLFDQMEQVNGGQLNNDQIDQIKRLSDLMYDIQNMSFPSQIDDLIHSNELAAKGGFASSVVVDKRDNTEKIFTLMSKMNEKEGDILGIIRDIHNNKL